MEENKTARLIAAQLHYSLEALDWCVVKKGIGAEDYTLIDNKGVNTLVGIGVRIDGGSQLVEAMKATCCKKLQSMMNVDENLANAYAVYKDLDFDQASAWVCRDLRNSEDDGKQALYTRTRRLLVPFEIAENHKDVLAQPDFLDRVYDESILYVAATRGEKETPLNVIRDALAQDGCWIEGKGALSVLKSDFYKDGIVVGDTAEALWMANIVGLYIRDIYDVVEKHPELKDAKERLYAVDLYDDYDRPILQNAVAVADELMGDYPELYPELRRDAVVLDTMNRFADKVDIKELQMNGKEKTVAKKNTDVERN